MYRKCENPTVIKYEEASDNQQQGGYKYLIRSSWSAYTAYRTDKGFEEWLKRSNIALELTDENDHPELGKVQIYKGQGTITEYLFWNQSELPEDAQPYTGLSNGSLVTCYYRHTEDGSEVYRPNSNAKSVYNPLPIDEHIAFNTING